MQLTDLMSVDEWYELEREIHERFGMDTNVFDISGIRITTFKNWVNRLCPEIKATDKGQSFICAVAHMNLSAMSKHTQHAVIEACDAGLVKIVVPIFVGGTFLGALGACGFRSEDEEIDSFSVNKLTDIPEETVDALATDIPLVSSQQAEALASYAESRIRDIVDAYHLKLSRGRG